ncbi:MAG TPA: S9 family peptidase [Pseudoxanthomonas sp.]|nr:S9 family peptidase [Pseudoxanthomonas sp.]
MQGRARAAWLGLVLAGGSWAAAAAQPQVDVDAFVRREEFGEIKLSPTGEYLAATLSLEDRTGLAILRLSDLKVTARFSLGRNTDIAGFAWANDTRVLVGVADKFGLLARPQPTGEIVALDADGKDAEMLVGQRVEASGAGTRLQGKRAENVWARLTDDLRGDAHNVLLTVGTFGEDPYTRVERMDVRSGRRVAVTRVPVRNASFLTDHAGVVRFAVGADGDNRSRLYYRPADGAEWTLLNDERASGRHEVPVGFSGDGATAYLRSSHPEGPDSIVAYDVATGARREALRDDTVDPYEIVYASHGPREPIGALFMDGRPRTAFFQPGHPDAKLQRMLEQAFPGEVVRVTSRTDDGRLALVLTTSDRNSGDYFVFDVPARKARRLVSRRQWLEPLQMAERQPVSLKARDGLPLHGYLTVPRGAQARNLPMVVLPHGGPYWVQDTWEFDPEAQMLAAAGYAVLQVNFRGSGGYGSAFERAGARQWGLAMQDDVTDATRWAIAEGIADPRRICIYGASYGAYAAMMGAVKEPALYRCAAGYVGVYDLVTRHRALASGADSLGTFAEQWIGTDRGVLAASSPNRLADRVRVPVLLAAGGQDEITPVEHTRMMEAGLRKAGVPVEALYYPTEGHGFYTPANLREYYGRLLGFLRQHLGGAGSP